MSRFRIFYGKVILFGEYSVLAGSSVVIVPYKKATAQLAFPGETDNESMRRSNMIISRLNAFLATQSNSPVDAKALSKDILKGLYVSSTIPEHAGLGSSGAVCAALYDRYKKTDITEMHVLQQKLAIMESCFHGSSSGIDPLSVLTGKPLIIEKSEYRILDPEKMKKNKPVPFLIDSGITCETAPLVNSFMDRYMNTTYGSQFREEYVPLVNGSAAAWEKGDLTIKHVIELSLAQSEFLSSMIPESVMPVWNAGIASGLYALKLCGSGGGGLFLGFTENLEETGTFLMEKFGLKVAQCL